MLVRCFGFGCDAEGARLAKVEVEVEDTWVPQELEHGDDDYDPRKPEYIASVPPEEARRRSSALLLRQISSLEASLGRRRDQPRHGEVFQHYESVLDDMRGSMKQDLPVPAAKKPLLGFGLVHPAGGLRGRFATEAEPETEPLPERPGERPSDPDDPEDDDPEDTGSSSSRRPSLQSRVRWPAGDDSDDDDDDRPGGESRLEGEEQLGEANARQVVAMEDRGNLKHGGPLEANARQVVAMEDRGNLKHGGPLEVNARQVVAMEDRGNLKHGGPLEGLDLLCLLKSLILKSTPEDVLVKAVGGLSRDGAALWTSLVAAGAAGAPKLGPKPAARSVEFVQEFELGQLSTDDDFLCFSV